MRVTNLLSSAVKCLQLQGALPLHPAGGTAPDPYIGSRSRARHILSVPVLFLTGNETWAQVPPVLPLPFLFPLSMPLPCLENSPTSRGTVGTG